MKSDMPEDFCKDDIEVVMLDLGIFRHELVFEGVASGFTYLLPTSKKQVADADLILRQSIWKEWRKSQYETTRCGHA